MTLTTRRGISGLGRYMFCVLSCILVIILWLHISLYHHYPGARTHSQSADTPPDRPLPDLDRTQARHDDLVEYIQLDLQSSLKDSESVTVEKNRVEDQDHTNSPPNRVDIDEASVLAHDENHSFDGLAEIFTQAFAELRKIPDNVSYEINTARSVSLTAARQIPDTRPMACLDMRHDTGNVTVSIVIPFYLEHWSALLRTLCSIYAHSPTSLVREIILVDDFNEESELQLAQRRRLADLPKVVLMRTKKREGLIRARMIGTRAARGDVLVILDAHVEVGENWLPPLLAAIVNSRSTIAVPALDQINGDTMEYWPWESADYGSFDWELDYLWIRMPAELEDKFRSGQPVPTSTFLGCAMAVDRDYWFSMGGYDEGLDVWGGESLEISFRTWMCGGRLLIVPCSKIGHVFRSMLPYISDMNIVHRNLQRVAEVWMDQYKKFYFQTTNKPLTFTQNERRSLSQRRELRESLQCHDFTWYLTNIAKAVRPPEIPCKLFGRFKNLASRSCLSVNASDQLYMDTCGLRPRDQLFYVTADHHIQYNRTSCLSCPGVTTQLGDCRTTDTSQKWLLSPVFPAEMRRFLTGTDWKKTVGRFMLKRGQYKQCLQTLVYRKQTTVTLGSCDHLSLPQYWIISHEIHSAAAIVDNLDQTLLKIEF